MAEDEWIEQAIARSSLGSSGARQLRARVPEGIRAEMRRMLRQKREDTNSALSESAGRRIGEGGRLSSEPDRDMVDQATSENGSPVQVLLCAKEVLRVGLRVVLGSTPDLAVVAEAADAARALELAVTLRPDVALVGFAGQGLGGDRNLVRELTTVGVRVVLLGQTGSDIDLVNALRAGARGYVLKTVSPARLVEAIRAVARGEAALDPHLLYTLDEPAVPTARQQASASDPLTVRQQVVAGLVAEGLTDAQIAARLQVSRATVKGHITVVLRRLGLRDRTQLAMHVHQTAWSEQA